MKKLLSIVLALVMVLTFMVPAFAEGTTVVYYVGDVQDGEAVAATAGETYTPDRMPISAAPEGKYFAGWKYNGEYVVDAITLVAGENKLEAVYKDYAASSTADLSLSTYAKNGENNVVLAPSYVDTLTPPYSNYVNYKSGGYWGLTNITDGSDTCLKAVTDKNASSSAFPLHNSDGTAIVVKPNTAYEVTVTYKLPVNAGSGYLGICAGLPKNSRHSGGNFASTPNLKYCAKPYTVTGDPHPNFDSSDNTIFYKNSTTVTEWETAVFKVTTNDFPDYIPVFTILIGGSGYGNNPSNPPHFIIKEVTVVDTSVAQVQYIANGKVENTVTGLTTGDTFTPNKMPEAETPEGKYFVGWADSTGKIVPNGGITLAEGENKLTAVYKSFAAETVVDLSRLTEGGALTSNIGYMKNGTYLGQVTARSSGAPKAEYITDEQTGETYLQVSPNASNNGGTGFPLVDADGDVIQGKWGGKYKIVMEFRIPENEGTMTMHANFGGKIYDSTKSYDQAPYFTNVYGNSLGLVKLGNFVAAAEYVGRWHDNGGYYNQFDNSGTYNPATVEDWATATFNITAGAQDDNYLPLFIVAVNTGGNAVAQKFQIKSIKVIDTSATDVQYIVNGNVEATETGLVTGNTYSVNRMPNAAAPANMYFSGWKNEAGEYVSQFTLEGGTTKLYASYVEFPGKGTSWGTYTWAKGHAFSAPYVNTNDELSFAVYHGSWLNYWPQEYNSETVFQAYNGNTWSTTAFFIVPNADGSAMQIEPGKTYNVTITYMNPDGASHSISMGAGLREDMLAAGTTAQGMAKNVGSMAASDDPEFIASRSWQYTLSSNGHNQYTIKGTSTEWLTATFSISTSADYTGYLPVLVFATGVAARSGFYIKDITVKDANWVEPATVAYYANGVLDGEKIANLDEGATYKPDRMPTAEAPAGKYFVGWANENGEIVSTKTGLVLAAGENKLTAVYKEYSAVTEVDLTNHLSTSNKVNVPYMKDDVYYSYVNGRNSGAGIQEWVTDQETGESYMKITNSTYSGGALFPLSDADGDLIQPKWGTSYKIVVEFRIPANESNIDLTSGFGAKPAKAPTFNHAWGVNSDIGGVPPVQYFGASATIPLTSKWHDHGGWFYRFGNGYENQATTDGWETITFNASSPAFTADWIPMFHLNVSLGTTNAEIHIKSIKIIDSTFAKVNYYADDEIIKSDASVTAGAAFTPAYIPEAPAGKFFAGWKDEAGNYVGKAGLTLAIGETNLYASFVDFVTDAKAHIATGDMYYANYDSNGENFQTTLPGGNFWFNAGTTEYEGKTYESIAYTSSANVKVSLVDENNVPLVFQPGKSYSISVKFKTLNGGNLGGVCLAGGFNASSEAGLRSGIGASYQAGGKQAINAAYSSQDANNLLTVTKANGGWNEWAWNITKDGHASYNIPAYSDWQTLTFNGTMAADYTGYYPVFMLNLSLPSGETILIDEITVKESNVHDKVETVSIAGNDYAAVKIADYVEDKATYRVTLSGSATADYAWYQLYFMTADAEDINSNRGYVEAAGSQVMTFGYTWATVTTKYITIDKSAGQGDALYVYIGNANNMKRLSVVGVEKIEAVGNDGAAILVDQPADATQAMRYYFTYNTTTGADIVLDSRKYDIASRGFLLADADNVGEAQVTRATAAEVGAIDMNTTDFTKCWAVTNTGTGVEKLTFSTYVKGFKADNGSYNNTNRLYVKGYVVLTDGTVIYGEEIALTVADIANELGLVG